MELGLRGKRALVTGATKGIGRAVAECLAEEGCVLHLVARSAVDLDALADALSTRYGRAVTVHPVDLAVREAPERLAVQVGPVDILVNNAGAIPLGTVTDVSEDAWRRSWDLKVFGYINLSRAVYQEMKQRREGVIVLIAGIAGQRPVAAYVAGTAANAALMGFGNALGGASLNDGIRVVTVNPGAVQTDRLEAALRVQAEKKLGDGSRWAELLRDLGLPGGRPATPKEVGDLVTFLASARASYVSGTVITIDGGLSSSNRMG